MFTRAIHSYLDLVPTPRTVNVIQTQGNPTYEMHQYQFYAQALNQKIPHKAQLLYRIIIHPKRG